MQIKLIPSQEQHDQLLATMRAFNQAATHAAKVAFADRVVHQKSIHNRCYYDLREQYGLSAQMAVRAIGKAVECFRRDKDSCPVFRDTGAMIYDERMMSFKGLDRVSLLTLGGRIIVPVIFGNYQAGYMERLKGQCDLVYRDGSFYLYCTVDIPEGTPIETERFLGVDLGIVNLATDSDGHKYSGDLVETIRQRSNEHRRTYQKTGTKSAKRRLKKLAGRESHFRKSVNHVISKEIVQRAKDTKAAIVLEELTHIRKRTRLRKRQRNQHSGWAFRELRIFIEYKAKLAGVVVFFVDPRNTSRTCNRCGFMSKRNRKSQAEFSCIRCGYKTHADQNAARNLATRGAVNRPDLVAPLSQLGFIW